MRRFARLAPIVLLLSACSKPPAESTGAPSTGPAPEPAPATGAATDAIRFWHTQTQENETALGEIVAKFNAENPDGPPVEAMYIGSYPELYSKIKASAADPAHADLPDLAVAYESMIADYMEADIVRPLDDLVADPEIGLSEEDLGDIFPAFLDRNRFGAFGGKLLSFPFTTSVLILYYNQDMLDEVGLKPPATWDELLEACRKIKAKRSIAPFAASVDASTIDGMIMSMGGELLKADGSAAFEAPATVAALKVLETMAAEELLYQVGDKGDQNNDLAEGKCAFFFRSVVARPYLMELIGDKLRWGMCAMPAGPGQKPGTVLFGANVCLFKSTPEREKRAWEFVKYFSSTPVTTQWAQATGYLPVRQSAAETEELKAFFAADPRNRVAFDLIGVAKPEPNVAGWQKVRDILEDAETSVITQLADATTAAAELDTKADAALKGDE